MKGNTKEKKSRINALLVVFLVLLGLALAAVIGIFLFFNHYYKKTNYVEDKESIEFAPTEADEFETLPADEEKELMERLEIERKEALENLPQDAKIEQKPSGNNGNETGPANSDGTAAESGAGGSGSGGDGSSGGGSGDGDGSGSESGDGSGSGSGSGGGSGSGSGGSGGSGGGGSYNPPAPVPTDVIHNDKVYNLLLIGVDRRAATWNGNSDAMILASVNYEKGKVMLTSFMRDTWVNVPGVGFRKLNAAFAIGNAPLLIQTMQLNFGIAVDNYAWVDFNGLKGVIDTLGGVDIVLTAAEGAHIGVPVSGASSLVHLNGAKALVYARDRTTSGWDYGRTQRQRNVLLALVNKARAGGFSSLNGAANSVLPYVTHNIGQGRMMSLLTDLPRILNFSFQQQRVPFDGLYYSSGYNLVPNYGATISMLYSTIY